jgi:hypothetical protein
VHDQLYVCLVHTHAKRNSGDHNLQQQQHKWLRVDFIHTTEPMHIHPSQTIRR